MTGSFDNLVVCPHCQKVFVPTEQIITETTMLVWRVAGPRFWYGGRLTLSQLAERANYSKTAVRRHLRRLVSVGLVEEVPLGSGKNGRVYHAYRGKLRRG